MNGSSTTTQGGNSSSAPASCPSSWILFFVNKREKIYYLKNFKKIHLSLLATCSATTGKPEQVAHRNI
jgi:hypothetical protein